VRYWRGQRILFRAQSIVSLLVVALLYHDGRRTPGPGMWLCPRADAQSRQQKGSRDPMQIREYSVRVLA
jgi:hypothetical protein